MQAIVTITSQGQVTIPKEMRKSFGITATSKAIARMEEGRIIIEPKMDFFDLAGNLKGDIKLSDVQLRRAREQFSKKWAKKEN